MATPTLRAIRDHFAKARITFLMNPNLRELVAGGDWMDECIEWPPVRTRSASDGPSHEIRRSKFKDRNGGGTCPRTVWGLRQSLRSREFDWAILLPNSFRAALIARLSGAKRRIGYDRDGRGFLLTDRIPVRNRRGGRWSAQRTLRSPRTSDPSVPSCLRAFVPSIQMGTKLPVRLGRYVPVPLVEYYADLAEAVGCESPGGQLELFTTPDCDESINRRLESLGIADRRPLVVISPGAKFGASKCWLPERFSAVADHLIESEGATVIVTCGPGEESIAHAIGAAMKERGFVLASARNEPPDRTPSASAGPPFSGRETQGRSLALPVLSQTLSLGELKSLIRRSDLLICNDAGPRHIAKAFDVPVVTVFGPTHPDWTSTSYLDERIVRIDVDCGPCQQRVCPLGHHQCMAGVTADMVHDAAVSLLRARANQHAIAP
jgi:heptosyltransferase-2